MGDIFPVWQVDPDVLLAVLAAVAVGIGYVGYLTGALAELERTRGE